MGKGPIVDYLAVSKVWKEDRGWMDGRTREYREGGRTEKPGGGDPGGDR